MQMSYSHRRTCALDGAVPTIGVRFPYPEGGTPMRVRIAAITAVSLLGSLVVSAPVGRADVPAGQLIDICEDLFGGVFGSPNAEPFGPCQWDMAIIDASATGSYQLATGEGVTVGVIDSGVDLTHPDIAPNLDVDRSCSFIFSDTPTANPVEIANGDCSNKAAVQDLTAARDARCLYDRGADQRHRDRRDRARGDDRRAQGLHRTGVLLRRLGCRRAPVRGRPAARHRQPESVRGPVPLLLQERGRAAGDPRRSSRRRPGMRRSAAC